MKMVAIAFVHPDLGIGGAERLVVDAAIALQSKGHKVRIFTSHHDSSHCFEETKDGTLAVTAVGDWLPRHIFWKLHAFFAYLRMIYVAVYLAFCSEFNPDIIFCDQVSVCIPVFKWRGVSKLTKVIFYCHFPDLLLTQRKSALKKIYRKPLDWLEEITTGMADIVMVNSKFTASIFHQTFKSLGNVTPNVLYPSINTVSLDSIKVEQQLLNDIVPPNAAFVFLSINRYERKKNLELAIHSLKELQSKVDEKEWKKIHLIMAGGYDERVTENKEHYIELRELANKLGLNEHVSFVRSFSNSQKVAFLKHSIGLLYTPSHEHFGLVPIEAMYMGCPVIACGSGGPLETVRNEETGYLCDSNPLAFSTAMKKLIEKPDLKNQLGDAGHQHVLDNFSFDKFAENLDKATKKLAFVTNDKVSISKPSSRAVKLCLFVAVAAIIIYCLSMTLLIRWT